MAKGRFFYNGVGSKYTLSATTEASDVENVLTPFPSNVWRSTTNGDQYVTFNSSTSRTIKAVCIFNFNMVSPTTFEVQCSNNDFSTHGDTSVTTITETLSRLDSDNELEYFTYRCGYAVIDDSYEDVRIKINSSESYYEIGFIGIYTADYTFIKNWVKKFKWGWRTENNEKDTKYGSTSITNLFKRREGNMIFEYISDAQNTVITRDLAINNHCVFFPDGLTSMYLVGVKADDVPENLSTITDDQKTISIKIIEKI